MIDQTLQPIVLQYCIGLVVPSQGVNDAQLAKLAQHMKAITTLLSRDNPSFKLNVKVAANELDHPSAIPEQISKTLQYKARFNLIELPKFKSLWPNSASFLYDQFRDCDEVWCCLGPCQGYRSPAKAAALYRYAKERPWLDPRVPNPSVKYKTIPAWVEMPADGHKHVETKPKGKQKWNALKWK